MVTSLADQPARLRAYLAWLHDEGLAASAGEVRGKLATPLGDFLKRTVPDCGFWLSPDTGHAVNLEEPDAFNALMADFYTRQT